MYVTIISTAIVNTRSIEEDIDNDGRKKLGLQHYLSNLRQKNISTDFST